jgi:hypothetical protein
VLAVALISEYRGWDEETVLLSVWRERQALFPNPPSQSRFHRRRRELTHALNLLRQWLLAQLDLAQDGDCIIDSLSIALVAFQHAARASDEWRQHQASFGKVSAKQSTRFGYKLHVLMTLGEAILD